MKKILCFFGIHSWTFTVIEFDNHFMKTKGFLCNEHCRFCPKTKDKATQH